MALIEEKDKRFKGIDRKVALFILSAFIGLVSVIAVIAVQQDVFTKKTRIYFIADSGQGLTVGMPIKLQGFKIGKVAKVVMDDLSVVRVELSIKNEYMKWIKTDSKAKIAKEGFIGEGIIDIIPGTEQKAAQIIPNAKITFEKSKDITEMVSEIQGQVIPIIKDVKELVHYVSTDPKGGVKVSLDNVAKLTGGLNDTKHRVDMLIASIDGTVKGVDKTIGGARGQVTGILNGVDSAVIGVNSIIKNVDGVIVKVDSNVSPMLKHVDKSLENVEGITGEIKKTIDKTLPKVPAIIDKGVEAADSATTVLDSVQKVWPISSHIEKAKSKTLKVDSFE